MIIFSATVSLSSPGRFETVALYRGELGTARRKAARKINQIAGRIAMQGGTVAPRHVSNFGESIAAIMRNQERAVASYAARVDMRGVR